MIILVNFFFAGSRGGHRDHRRELYDALHEVREEADHQRAAEELHQQDDAQGSAESGGQKEEAGQQRLHSRDRGGGNFLESLFKQYLDYLAQLPISSSTFSLSKFHGSGMGDQHAEHVGRAGLPESDGRRQRREPVRGGVRVG